MTGLEGSSEFCFPRIEQSSLFPKGPVIMWFVINKRKADVEKRAEILATSSTFICTLWSRATAVNISWVTVNCFPFYIIISAMLPAHGIWWETVSLLDVMWPWTSQWMGALEREKRQLYNNNKCITLSSNWSSWSSTVQNSEKTFCSIIHVIFGW